MMNYGSRSKAIILAAILAAACTRSVGEIRFVRAGSYDSRPCWFDRSGDFVAFLVFGRADRVAVPYPISTRCVVSAGYGSYGEATLLHMGAIGMADSYGTLQRALPDVIISDSVRTDQPFPSGDSIVYYFRARVTRVGLRHLVAYAPQNITKLTETNMRFGPFLRLSRESRERLAREYELPLR
jgi:hypothetical protein